MTRPSNFFASTDGDLDLQSLLNSREFQALLSSQQYPNANNPFPHLAQYLLENFNIRLAAAAADDDDGFDDSDSDESIVLSPVDPDEDDAYADRLLQAIVSGQREVPMRRILPATPPPSPLPNPALNVPYRQQRPPPLPPRRRSQLATSMTSSGASFAADHRPAMRIQRYADRDAAEEQKSPHGGYAVFGSPLDKNNDLPLTPEYQNRLRQRFGMDFEFPGR